MNITSTLRHLDTSTKATLAVAVAFVSTSLFADPVGFWEAKKNAYFEHRILSEQAKTVFYDEAENAFRTHYDDNGSWQGEYWGKTMLSVAAVARMRGDRQLRNWAVEKAKDFVKKYQREDGYLCSYSDPAAIGPNADGTERFCWNIWSRKYTMWALIEISDFAVDRGDAELLIRSARKIADHLIGYLDEHDICINDTGYFAGLASMSFIKPLMILYHRTEDRRYLDFTAKTVSLWERTGRPVPSLIANAFSPKPLYQWYDNPGWWAKGYEMMSCLEGIVEYAREIKDERLIMAVRNIVEKIAADELHPLCSVGYFDHFTNAKACPNVTTELCDAMHWIRINRDLFRVTKDAKYLDRMELAFFNGFLPGIFRDGKWCAHGTRSHGTRQFTAPHQVGMKYHHCCVDNACRIFEDFESSRIYREHDVIYVCFFYDAKYPFAGRSELTLPTEGATEIRFRAPSYFDHFSVNDVKPENGWVKIDCRLKREIALVANYRLPVRVHEWKTAKGADPRPQLFEQTGTTPEMKGLARKEGAVYLMYGPMLLAKNSLLGTPKKEILDFDSVLGKDIRVRLEPIPANGKVLRAWNAVFRLPEKKTFKVPVCDFQSCDIDDPNGAFSIWF